METSNLNETKRGYLKGDFAFFHLKDMKNVQFEYHYHDFSKLVVFISGNVTYLVEGKAYRLKPWDILFVDGSEVHKAVIDPTVLYERIVIWVNHGFLENHSDDYSLMTCFSLNAEKNSNLLRLDHTLQTGLGFMLAKLEEACRNEGFGSAILKNAILLQLLVELTRERLKVGTVNGVSDTIIDDSIQNLLDYINTNISGDLSIESLSAKFYTSRYHLMHKFKRQTGYSVHSYIQQKRLFKADALIRSGIKATQASEQCGFNDYSSFARAYGKMFGSTPRNRIKQ
jgi:AraC-like DNA-binding protein